MDLPILLILVAFAIAVFILGFRYRKQIMDEVEDIFDGDDDDGVTRAEPPAAAAPLPAKEAQSEGSSDEFLDDSPVPPPATAPVAPSAPARPAPAAPAGAWDLETGGSDEERQPQPTRGEGASGASPQTPPSSAIVPSDTVKFSAYYPRETAPQVWQPLAVYAFRQSAAADVIKDVGTVLATRMPEFRRIDEDARQTIQDGAMITAVPNLPGFQVNPPQITLGFYEPFHRFDFKVRATSAPLDQSVNGVITFTVEGVIVADLPISLFVGRAVGEAMTGAVTKPAYTSIFCSYSRDDTAIIERVERAYRALGLTYLRDVETLRSGQNWNEELMRLIEQADIFQLFWSPSAAESKYVRQEWEHALKNNRAIRPVYWQKPIPSVPTELRSLHFAYMPDLVE
jgi:hypothetical protein